jgi:hypothetical protein
MGTGLVEPGTLSRFMPASDALFLFPTVQVWSLLYGHPRRRKDGRMFLPSWRGVRGRGGGYLRDRYPFVQAPDFQRGTRSLDGTVHKRVPRVWCWVHQMPQSAVHNHLSCLKFISSLADISLTSFLNHCSGDGRYTPVVLGSGMRKCA